MSRAIAGSQPVCAECGADVRPGASSCWLCHAPAAVLTEEVVMAEVVAEPPPFAPGAGRDSLVSALVLVTLAAVGLGLGLIEPGYGILFAVVVAPAVLATVVRSLRVRAQGREPSWLEKGVTFLVSAVVVAGTLVVASIVLVVALCAALFSICISAFTNQ